MTVILRPNTPRRLLLILLTLLAYQYWNNQIEEMRNEMQKAQKAEQRLRSDRDEWRLMAENLQAPADAEAEEEEEDEG